LIEAVHGINDAVTALSRLKVQDVNRYQANLWRKITVLPEYNTEGSK